jgi:predicted AlkP superfamily pyrophosphatase or phosphodiesterase
MKNAMLKLLCGASLGLAASAAQAAPPPPVAYHHVLLISVDGMHAVDLQNYIASHPASTLASLANHGVRYPAALTTAPSDSFPGLLAQVTGGTSKSTGVWYDVSYDRTMFGPGSNCQGAPGWQPAYDESVDYDKSSYMAGGTPGNVLSQMNPANLPMKLVNGACTIVYPHSFLKVNTIFEVIKAARLRTAWADKHPTYDIVNGPSGAGVDDLYAVEVNSTDPIYPAITDTTTGFHSVQRNDQLKVNAILNEINGLDSTGAHAVGVPAIFGMNFQAVSVGQKLKAGNTNDPLDAGLVGGYGDAVGLSPNNGLQSGLDYVDGALGSMISALNTAGLANDTLVIVSAKHGQSPIDITTRVAVSDAPYGAAPGMGNVGDQGAGAYTTDDVGLVWLSPSTQKMQYNAAERYLGQNASVLHIDSLRDRGHMLPDYNNPMSDDRTPDFIAIVHPGVIYTSGSKLAEHGGFAENDRNVALLVSNPKLTPSVRGDNVQTRQIAPTILRALGLDPRQLQAVKAENTQSLPGLPF